MSDKLTLTAKEAAELLNVSMPVLYSLARSEDFPAAKIGLGGTGKKLLISRTGLERWLAEKTGA